MAEPSSLRGREGRRLLWAYAVLLAFYLLLAAWTPYAHDDWDWGLEIGLEQWRTASLNSRYGGNTVEVLLTRSALLKTLVMGGVFTAMGAALLGFVKRAGEKVAAPALLLAAGNLLILLMPRAIWRQTYGWVAGFSNFVTSGLLLVLYHGMLLRRRERRASIPALLGAFAFGVGMQLFLENTAIYAVAASLLFVILRWVKNKRPDGVLLALFLGNVLGLVVIFSNPIYTQLFAWGYALGGTREFVYDVQDSFTAKALRSMKYYVKYFPILWNQNLALSCSILALLTLLTEKKRRVKTGLCNGALALYFVATRCFGELPLPSERGTIYFAVCMGLLYGGLVVWECWRLFRGERTLGILLFVWLSAPAVVAPLAVTDMEGGRLFLAPYLFEAEFCLLLLARLTDGATEKARQRAAGVCGLLLALVMAGHLAVYQSIGRTTRERLSLLAQAAPGDTVTLPAYPYEGFLFKPDPDEQWRVDCFKEFYGVDERVELFFASGAPEA